MNFERKNKENIYKKIEASLTSNIQDMLEEYSFEKERKEFMETIDIQEEVQKDVGKDNLENATIEDSVAFREAISKAENGTILRVDKQVLEESIKKSIPTGSIHDLLEDVSLQDEEQKPRIY